MKQLNLCIQGRGLLQQCLIASVLFAALIDIAQGAVELEQVIVLAQTNDPWLTGSEHRQRSLEDRSVYAGTLPDPTVTLGMANMPVDSFDFNQEAMTQLKVGVSQQFPRGDTRALQKKRLNILSTEHPHLRQERRARVAVDVTVLYLEAFRARESIRLIEQERGLFEYLVDIARSNYSSALGRTRQQDLVRAQLQLTRLEDRLTLLRQREEVALARLGEWLGRAGGELELAAGLPPVAPSVPGLVLQEGEASLSQVSAQLLRHPAILSIDSKVAASEAGVELAEQKYRPQWRLDASYGYRDDDPVGMDRSDFFSVGVAFDLPLFTSKRQDRGVQSAIATTEAVRTERALALRKMLAAFDSQRVRLLRLDQRRELYQSRLLQQMSQLAEASLAAYTHDDGDFSEVVQARIAELNARIEALDIDVDRLATIAELNYFFAGTGA